MKQIEKFLNEVFFLPFTIVMFIFSFFIFYKLYKENQENILKGFDEIDFLNKVMPIITERWVRIFEQYAWIITISCLVIWVILLTIIFK